ncbi:iron-dicitrate transporter ATP-binding subunit [Brochothrix thermosphacta]|uniref:ABC transporter ATP-binding protein n=1 Tax=Brochothrix thermosphacta TaxID=2756 RepID=UPI000E71F91C|nr:ABC transporter ATP-binding protein [Brochothrix thermosphacta]ANZ96298.1 iron-dicitrate transporter ATP-binding subunit [Brochothrix thermosphacta]
MKSIETKALSIAYDERYIVEDLNLSLSKGKITSIIGANGCGKSTIIKTIGRVLRQKAGVVTIDGADIRKLPTKIVAKKMAVLPQQQDAPSGMTVKELVYYGRYPHQKGFAKPTQADKDIVSWAIKVTGLADFEQREVDTLSGGQRQKVWIAMALAQETDVVLLDEPTTYLDLSHQLEILELLEALNREQNRTIIMVLHDINLAARFSDEMVAIGKGKIIADGPVTEVMTTDVLEQTFQIDAVITTDPRTTKPVCITYNLLK